MPNIFYLFDQVLGQSIVYCAVIYIIDKKLIKKGGKCPENGEIFLYLHPIIDINQYTPKT